MLPAINNPAAKVKAPLSRRSPRIAMALQPIAELGMTQTRGPRASGRYNSVWPCSIIPRHPLPCCVLLRILKGMELLTRDEIVRLSPPERLALIAQLGDSLEHEQLPLTSAQQAELERRLTSLDQDRRDGVTWSALKAELAQRCP
jgi:putative addiction module component (TIGR02574 family)